MTGENIERKIDHTEEGEHHFSRKDTGSGTEIEIIRFDSKGSFIAHSRMFFDQQGKAWRAETLDEHGAVHSSYEISYGPGVWDAEIIEHDGAGMVIGRKVGTWDDEFQAKAEIYYDARGAFAGKKIDTRDEDHYYRPRIYDRDGKLLPPF